MEEMLTPHWIICYHLVLKMKTSTFNAISTLFVVTTLVVGVAGLRGLNDDAEAVATQQPPPIVVEEKPQAVDNSVNDVHNSVNDGVAYTDEELEILAIIIYQEAGSDACSDDTRRKVGSVFLNRVNSPSFPNTFKGVATAKRQYGRLYWTGIKWPDRASNAGEQAAVRRAYDIAEELLLTGSILPSNVIWQAEFRQGDGLYCYQDKIYFCYSEVNK